MRTTVLGLLLVLGFTASAWAWGDDDEPIVLHDGSWICSTPEAYETAIELESTTDKTFSELKKDLLDRKLCMYVDGGDIEDMMAPYVIVVDQRMSFREQSSLITHLIKPQNWEVLSKTPGNYNN